MKKILMITAIFLLGIGSLSAQGAWEVKVNWDISTSECANYSGELYKFVVGLTIYDEANNDAIVCNSAYKIVPLSASSTVFSSTEAGVQAYCENNHDNTPSLTVIAVVRVINNAETEQYCVAKATNLDLPCSYFTGGYVIYPLFP